MEYNTSREKLLIPEYGRNVQKMIKCAIEEKNKDKRTKTAHLIIKIMAKLAPNVYNTVDYKQKLWDHLFLISEFKLDVDSPYPMPTPENKSLKEKSKRFKYPKNNIRFKHYGSNIARMLEKSAELKDGAEKATLINYLANHLKRSYLLLWNKNSVNDELIKEHIFLLSKNKIKSNQYKLNSYSEILTKTKKKKKHQHKKSTY